MHCILRACFICCCYCISNAIVNCFSLGLMKKLCRKSKITYIWKNIPKITKISVRTIWQRYLDAFECAAFTFTGVFHIVLRNAALRVCNCLFVCCCSTWLLLIQILWRKLSERMKVNRYWSEEEQIPFVSFL